MALRRTRSRAGKEEDEKCPNTENLKLEQKPGRRPLDDNEGKVISPVSVFRDSSLNVEELPELLVEGFFSASETHTSELVDSNPLIQGVEVEDLVVAVKSIQAWSSRNGEDGGANLWAVLSQEGIQYRPLVVALDSLMRKDLSEVQEGSTQDAEISVLASTLFLEMAQIAGNYNFANPIALRSSFRVLRDYAKKKKTAKKKEITVWESEPLGSMLKEYLNALTKTFVKLQVSEDMLSYSIENLIEATRASCDNSISSKLFLALENTMSEVQSSRSLTWKMILKGIKSNILMEQSQRIGQTQYRQQVKAVRKMSLSFVKKIGNKYQDLVPRILVLIHHLCFYCPEKTEPRGLTVSAVLELLVEFPSLVEQKDFCKFVRLLSRNGRVGRRVLAVELAGKAIQEPTLFSSKNNAKKPAPTSIPATPRADAMGRDGEEKEAKAKTDMEEEEEKEEEKQEQKAPPVDDIAQRQRPGRSLLNVIISRCSDRAAIVTAAALKVLGETIEAIPSSPFLSAEFFSLVRINEMFSPAGLQTPGSSNSSRGGGNTSPVGSFSLFPMEITSASSNGNTSIDNNGSFQQNHQDTRRFLHLLEKRCADPRPGVRKASVKVLEALLTCDPQISNGGAGTGLLSEANLQAIFDACMDASISVRKQGMDSISNLIECYPQDTILQKIWLGAVLPLAIDPEMTIQFKAMQYIQTVILERVSRCLYAAKNSDPKAPIWTMLSALDDSMQRYLQQALAAMVTRDMIPNGFMKRLNGATSTDIKGVWMFLRDLSFFYPEKIDGGAIKDAWWRMIEQHEASWKGEKKKKRSSYSNTSEEDDSEFLLASATEALGNIALKQPIEDGKKRICSRMLSGLSKGVCGLRVVKSYVKALSAMMTSEGSSSSSSSSLWDAQLLKQCTERIRNYLFQKNKSANTKISEDEVSRYLFTMGEVVLMSHPDKDNVKINAEMLQAVQSLLQPSITDMISGGAEGSPSDESKLGGVFSAVRAHAFTTLGKFCLRNKSLTRKMVPVMIRELKSGESPVVRNNVLVVLCDMCRAFTDAVDGQIDAITACLRDDNEVVRRHSLMIMIQLLQEDYIKWKGPMFFRALRTVVDSDQGVKLTAKGALTKLIVAKWPRQFHKHFVEAIFYLNDYRSHKTYNKFSASSSSADSSEETKFALCGKEMEPLRRHLYQYMLKFMQDEHKFNTVCKLCQDIIGGVVEKQIRLDGPDGKKAHAVLTDCLSVLASKGIKLRVSREQHLDPDVVDERVLRLEAARGKILSKIFKKNAMENIVPLLIELKHLLERRRSPVIKPLMAYLKELLSDYKDEIDEILVSDPQLAAELKYDLEQFEERERKTKERCLQDLKSIGCLSTPIVGMPSVTPRKNQQPSSRQTPMPASSSSSRRKSCRFSTPRLKNPSSARKLNKAATSSLSMLQQRPQPPLSDLKVNQPSSKGGSSSSSSTTKNTKTTAKGGKGNKTAGSRDKGGAGVFKTPAPVKIGKRRVHPSPAYNDTKIVRSPPTKNIRVNGDEPEHRSQ